MLGYVHGSAQLRAHVALTEKPAQRPVRAGSATVCWAAAKPGVMRSRHRWSAAAGTDGQPGMDPIISRQLLRRPAAAMEGLHLQEC